MAVTLTQPKVDADIQRDVLQELRWDPRVNETEVGVQVRDGVVTLTGNVSNFAKRVAAAEAAHRVAGVLDVANDLTVRIPGVGKKSDSEIAKALRHALMWDVFVPDEYIQSTVTNGWVTLEGEVDRWIQRTDAERVVHRLAGVVGVTNRIMVKADRADATVIRRSIEEALDRQAEREAKRLTIGVDNGIVHLKGTVRSWGERHAVEQAAGFARGVQRVDSKLEVDPYM